MKWLSDAVLAHLGEVADWPDLEGTRYDLLDKLGQGGMGTVFLARDIQLDRLVALKVLRVHLASAEAQTRMLREAQVLGRLEHPSIVPIHDAGVLPDGRFYYAMKYVRGSRLDNQPGPPAPLAERLQLFRKICDAVAFAHAQGVLHRDLKPQNIMLGAFGEVLVLDWGVAKLLGEEKPPAEITERQTEAPRQGPLQTGHGTVLGTPGYMAPEQARGEVDRLDQRADVYGLGAILYFLLTGHAPSTDTSLLPRPRSRDRSIPRPVEAVCLKALAAESTARYASAADLGDDLARFLAGKRVQAYPEGILGALLRLAGRHRVVVGLVLAYAIMRVLLLIFLGR